jgi:hypothetical protein
MTKSLRILAPLCLIGSLSACGLFKPPAVAPVAPAEVASTNPMVTLGESTSAEALDTTTDAEKAEALEAAPEAGERALGVVTVALGSPTEPGFWIRSNLVSVAATGRVETSGGASVAVDLLPTDGPAILSFAAFRALELPLTDLPDVTVYTD